MAKPIIRVTFKNKTTNVVAECGVVWGNDFGGGNFKPQLEDIDGKYPKMKFSRALELEAQGEGYINMFPNGPEKGVKYRIAIVSDEDEYEDI